MNELDTYIPPNIRLINPIKISKLTIDVMLNTCVYIPDKTGYRLVYKTDHSALALQNVQLYFSLMERWQIETDFLTREYRF